MAQDNNAEAQWSSNDLLLVKALIVVFLVSVSAEPLKAVILVSGNNIAKVYLSVVINVLFSAAYLFLPIKIRPPKTIIALFLLYHLWILVRLFYSPPSQGIYPYFTLLNSFNAFLSICFAAPIIFFFRLERFLLQSFVFIASIVSLIGAVHTLAVGMPPMGEVATLSENHMEIGLYMTLSLSCALYLIRNPSTNVPSYLIALATGMSLLGTILSGSRASTLSCIFILAAFALTSKSAKLKAAIGIGIVVLGIGFIQQMEARIAATNTFEMSNGINVDFSTGFRFFIWWGILQLLASDPSILLFGLGYEALGQRFNDLVYFPVYVSAAHNIFLQLLGELGVVGFLLFFGSLGFLLLGFYRSRPEVKYIFLPCVIALLATGVFQETFYANAASGNFTALFWFISGTMLLVGRSSIEPKLSCP